MAVREARLRYRKAVDDVQDIANSLVHLSTIPHTFDPGSNSYMYGDFSFQILSYDVTTVMIVKAVKQDSLLIRHCYGEGCHVCFWCVEGSLVIRGDEGALTAKRNTPVVIRGDTPHSLFSEDANTTAIIVIYPADKEFKVNERDETGHIEE